jgi:phosphatidylglycerophosphatase C
MQLALFDLDGTITRHDTLVPYVTAFLRTAPWRIPRLMGVVPALVRYAFRRDRGDLKQAIIRSVLGGLTRGEIEALSESFVAALIPRGTFARARERIESHRAAGDVLVLMSASPDLYVPVVARALGFAKAICTEVRWEHGRLDGTLISANRRGEEKARCLAGLRQRHPGLQVTAYGNSSSDLDHLALADRGVLVNGSSRAQSVARSHGIDCERWT